MRDAQLNDLPLLLNLMTAFYAESGYCLDREHGGAAFRELLSDARLGRVWIFEAEGENAGYMVVTFRFGMEYGGLMACLDDLYVVPAYRNRGLSTGALEVLRGVCLALGVRAITVEVDPANGAAQTVYRRAGLVEEAGRQLLALALAAPSHVRPAEGNDPNS